MDLIINYLRKRGFSLIPRPSWGGYVLDGYPYLKHIIKLCPGDWVKKMAKINEMAGMNNCLLIYGGKKQLRLVRNLKRQVFWKCIRCILSEVMYRNKGNTIWSETPITVDKKPPTKLHRYVHGNTDIHRVCCDIYCTYYCHA